MGVHERHHDVDQAGQLRLTVPTPKNSASWLQLSASVAPSATAKRNEFPDRMKEPSPQTKPLK